MEPLVVTRTIALPVSVGEAWRSVQAGGWLGDRVAVELVAGASGTIADDGTVRRVVVTDVDPETSLRLVWWDEDRPAQVSTVDVRVEADGDGATVTVTERVLGGSVAGFAEATVADLRPAEATWDRRLRALVGEVALAPAVA
jgi:hypothetical protein